MDKQIVMQTAKLARLSFNNDELSAYADQLTKILDYIEQLKELSVESVEPFVHPGKIENVTRADEIKTSLKPDQALQNAPEKVGDFFSVPKVVS